MGYYPWQSQGSEAVSWENQIVGWGRKKWLVSGRTDLNIGNFRVTETEVYHQGRKILIWNWYLVGNWDTPNPKIAKLFDAVNIIIHRRNDASFLTLATPIITNKLDSRKKLEAFHEAAHQELHQILSSVISEAL